VNIRVRVSASGALQGTRMLTTAGRSADRGSDRRCSPAMSDEIQLPELLESIRESRFTMFTTRDREDRLRARPMTTLEATDDGSLWFFGVRASELVTEAAADPRVGLAYADNGAGSYAFVSGRCHLREDRAKVEQLWSDIHKAWYDGPDDPDLQLLEVRIETAEYWDGPDSGVVRFLGILKAAITGEEHEVEHGEIEVAATTGASRSSDKVA
jgi:general stress protein 26